LLQQRYGHDARQVGVANLPRQIDIPAGDRDLRRRLRLSPRSSAASQEYVTISISLHLNPGGLGGGLCVPPSTLTSCPLSSR
jgi:hypothetical protein